MNYYSQTEYEFLKSKYSKYSSWAIWNYQRESDTLDIDKSINDLHAKYVLIGLNISASLKQIPWINFHGGKHDRKLKYACNDTSLRGSYITDLFKDIPQSNSAKFFSEINQHIIDHNVNLFIEEMKNIKITDETCFVLMGADNSQIVKTYNTYFGKHFDNKVINYCHYSYYSLTDQSWVEGFWKKLKIEANFQSTIQNY